MANTDSANGDVLAFWATKYTARKRLSIVAQGLLGVPAASTSSERAFSLAGLTPDERRTQLSPQTVDGLLFVHGLKDM